VIHLLHLHWWATNLDQTLNFETPCLRGLHMVRLAGEPVTLRPEDLESGPTGSRP